MAEKVELNPEEINLLKWDQVKTGLIKMRDEDVEIFENQNWETFISMIGYKMIERYGDVIQGECIINFFPSDLEEFNKVMEMQNTTIMGQQLVRPLFYIKFNKDKHIESISKNENKIPKDIMFIILCK